MIPLVSDPKRLYPTQGGSSNQLISYPNSQERLKRKKVLLIDATVTPQLFKKSILLRMFNKARFN